MFSNIKIFGALVFGVLCVGGLGGTLARPGRPLAIDTHKASMKIPFIQTCCQRGVGGMTRTGEWVKSVWNLAKRYAKTLRSVGGFFLFPRAYIRALVALGALGFLAGFIRHIRWNGLRGLGRLFSSPRTFFAPRQEEQAS